MKITGVFYHEICGKEAFKSLAMSVKEGFEILGKENLFSESNVILFEAKPIEEEWIAKIHTRNWIDYVKRTQYWQCSLYSIGGFWQATEKVLTNEVDNGLVYVGVGGHHAHPDNAWGGCYFNIMAIGINLAREKLKVKRFAIIDTDTHHADGTRDIFKTDEDILHICFCGGYPWDYNFGSKMESKTKLCFPHGVSDDEEIENIKKEVPKRIEQFKPELIYWLCGLDTHKDSYGTACLTERCYPKLAKIIKDNADQVCQGRLIVKTGCNAPAYVSEYVNPRIVDYLAELGKYREE